MGIWHLVYDGPAREGVHWMVATYKVSHSSSETSTGDWEISLPGGALDGAHRMAIDAMRRVERVEGRSLAACLSGFWFNVASGNETVYPFYMVRVVRFRLCLFTVILFLPRDVVWGIFLTTGQNFFS